MQRLVYILLYPLAWLTSLLPLWWLYVKSSALYVLVYYLVGYRKKVVMGNLRLAFPTKTNAELKNIAKKFYQHLCDLIFESIKNLTISESQAKRRFQFENLEVLEALYQQGKSVLLMCGHYASWEWVGILDRQNPFDGYAVYKPLDNPYFDRLVRKTRGRFGPKMVTNKKIVPTLFRLHKEGKKTMTLILSDQTPKLGAFKHRDDFMGVNVPVFTGTEELAKKLDFATVYLKVKKVKRGYYAASFELLSDTPTSVPDYDITRKFLDEIEAQIKEEPSYYLWSHKRWKHRDSD